MQDLPVGTTVNISPGRDLAFLLTADEYIDILDSIHLAGVLQHQSVRARARNTQTELELRL